MKQYPDLDAIIARAQHEIRQQMRALLGAQVQTWAYGATDIDPKHLAIIIMVDTDAQKTKLNDLPDLKSRLQEILRAEGYPKKAIREVGFAVESQENVDRVSGGNWYHHFK